MPQQTPTVASSTYEQIKHDIIFGQLAPASKLKLDTLKTRYNASVSTLRETLNRLASEGFVDAPEQRGFLVKPISQHDLVEIAELRILLECSAIEASITTGDAEWEGRVVAAHHKLHLVEQQMQAGDSSKKELWKKCDWEFHQSVIQACDSANLLALHKTIFDKYLRYQMLILTFRGEIASTEHRAILEAALDRDVAASKQFLKAHVMGGLSHTLAAMDGK